MQKTYKNCLQYNLNWETQTWVELLTWVKGPWNDSGCFLQPPLVLYSFGLNASRFLRLVTLAPPDQTKVLFSSGDASPARHFCASKQPAFLSALLQAPFHIQSVAARLLQCPLSIWTYRLSPAANRMAPFPHSPGHQSAPLQLVTGGGMGKPTPPLHLILSSFSRAWHVFQHLSAPLSASLWLNGVNKSASLHLGLFEH